MGEVEEGRGSVERVFGSEEKGAPQKEAEDTRQDAVGSRLVFIYCLLPVQMGQEDLAPPAKPNIHSAVIGTDPGAAVEDELVQKLTAD